MHSLKDKVSRFFSDSAISPTGQPQAKSYSSTGGKYLHSFLSYMNPAAHPDEYKSYPWNSSEWQDKHFHFGESSPEVEDGKSNVLDNDDHHSSERSTSDSEVFEDAPDPPSPAKAMDNLTENSSFITPKLYEFFQSSLPNIVKGCQWVLLYSTLKHGTSLRTLIRKSSLLSGPCLLIVGDTQGAVFGGLLECPLKPTAKRKYQGTSQSFVYTNIYGEPRLFRPTGYIGHDKGGQLAEAVRLGPCSVILFDEVEKVHHSIFNAALQVLDDWRLTDGQGRTVDFRNTVIIMTSYLGAEHLIAGLNGRITAEEARVQVMQEVTRRFKPELLSQLEEIVVCFGKWRDNNDGCCEPVGR